MEQKNENVMETVAVWVQPIVEIVGVSLECTAYAGASTTEV